MPISLNFTRRFKEVVLSTSVIARSHTAILENTVNSSYCGLLSRNSKKSNKQSPHNQNLLLAFQAEIIL